MCAAREAFGASLRRGAGSSLSRNHHEAARPDFRDQRPRKHRSEGLSPVLFLSVILSHLPIRIVIFFNLLEISYRSSWMNKSLFTMDCAFVRNKTIWTRH